VEPEEAKDSLSVLRRLWVAQLETLPLVYFCEAPLPDEDEDEILPAPPRPTW